MLFQTSAGPAARQKNLLMSCMAGLPKAEQVRSCSQVPQQGRFSCSSGLREHFGKKHSGMNTGTPNAKQ